MVLVKCLYCDSDNDPRATGGYCEACGKKLPPASVYRSRRAPGEEVGSTDLPTVRTDRYRTMEALFTVAVLRLIAGGLFLVLGPLVLPKVPEKFVPVVMGGTVAGLFLYGLLALWARGQPRAAALTALVVFVLEVGIGFVLEPIGAAWGLIVQAVLLVFLIRAVQISARDRG
jgi:hypothetical protein